MSYKSEVQSETNQQEYSNVKMNFSKKQIQEKQEFLLSCINKNDLKLPKYNGLTDKYLVPYFKNSYRRQNLLKNGLINESNEILETKKIYQKQFFSPQQIQNDQKSQWKDKENNPNTSNQQFSYIKCHEKVNFLLNNLFQVQKLFLYEIAPITQINLILCQYLYQGKKSFRKIQQLFYYQICFQFALEKNFLSSITLQNLSNKNYCPYKNLQPLTKEELQTTFLAIQQKVNNNIRNNQYATKQQIEINQNINEKQSSINKSSKELIQDSQNKESDDYDNDFQDEQEVEDANSQQSQSQNKKEEASNYNSDFEN